MQNLNFSFDYDKFQLFKPYIDKISFINSQELILKFLTQSFCVK